MSARYTSAANRTRDYFAMLPHMADDDLNLHEYRLYGHYKRIAGETGTVYESQNTIIEKIGMGRNKLIETRKSLETKGYIRVIEPRGRNQSYRIEIVDRWDENAQRYARKDGCSGINEYQDSTSQYQSGIEQSPKKNLEEPNMNNQQASHEAWLTSSESDKIQEHLTSVSRESGLVEFLARLTGAKHGLNKKAEDVLVTRMSFEPNTPPASNLPTPVEAYDVDANFRMWIETDVARRYCEQWSKDENFNTLRLARIIRANYGWYQDWLNRQQVLAEQRVTPFEDREQWNNHIVAELSAHLSAS